MGSTLLEIIPQHHVIDDEWVTVCDDDWDVLDATIVCHEVGYLRNTATPDFTAYSSGPSGIYDNVACTDSELNLRECRNNGPVDVST